MTDKEIEKALEICGLSDFDCKDCPYFNSVTTCLGLKDRDAYDYIQRLKAENERLKRSDQSKEVCTIDQHAEIHRLRDEIKQIRKDTAKEILTDLYNREEMGYDVIKWYAKSHYGIEVEE